MVRPTARVTKGGQTLSERMWALIADAKNAAGLPPEVARVVQGSWSDAVGQSAGTHAGGGAFDLSVALLTRAQSLGLVDQLRRRGVCAWLRTPEFGWPAYLSGAHIHGVDRCEPGLSKAAKAQVRAYDANRNGLANKARDPFPRPGQAPFWVFGQPAPWPGWRLQEGSTGDAVVTLQRALEEVPDGDYGPATKAAVKRFQLTRPKLWPADGICGSQTYRAAIEWGWR